MYHPLLRFFDLDFETFWCRYENLGKRDKLVTIKLKSEISISDIPFLRQNDNSICKTKIAPIISNSEYRQWISTQGVRVVTARNKEEIIGQAWAHPLKLFQNNEPIKEQFFWIHNIKVHPKWQNKGVYRQISDCFDQTIFSRDVQRLLLVNVSNTRMRHLAIKSKFYPIMKIPGIILFRYYFSSKIFRRNPLKIVKSQVPPEFWKLSVLKQNKYWIPQFSWDDSPEWFSFYIKDKLICILQITQPIHPTQGRSMSKLTVKVHTTQIRYLSFTPSFSKLHPSVIRSIFVTLFSFFPNINAFILILNPTIMLRLMRIPRVLISSRAFILYSTTKDPELVNNNLDFQDSLLTLNSRQE
jgi:hypothetical protein